MEKLTEKKIRCPRKLKKALKEWTQCEYFTGIPLDITMYEIQKRRGFFDRPL